MHSNGNNKLYTKIDRNTTFSKIPNVGFPEIVYDHIVTKPLGKVLSKEDFDDLRLIDTNGKEREFTEKITSQEIINTLKTISKKFKLNLKYLKKNYTGAKNSIISSNEMRT